MNSNLVDIAADNTVTKTVTDLRFLGDWSVWIALALALLLAGAAWAYYWREVRTRPGRERWALPTLRALAVFLLVMMLAGPVLHHQRSIGELARIFVFVDASKSLSVTDDFMEKTRKLNVARSYGWWDPDVLKTNFLGMATSPETITNAMNAAIEKFDAVPRWQRVEQMLLDEKDGLLPKLAKKHHVELWAITGAQPKWLWSSEQGLTLTKNFAIKPDNDSTDLNGAIAARLGERRDERSAVLLVSDGQHNSGGSPLETAKIAGSRNIPLFTLSVGAVERPNDLAVMEVTTPQSVFFEDRVKGEVILKDDMPLGQPFVLKIKDGDQTLWEKALSTERTHRRKVEFDFPIKDLLEARKAKNPGIEFTSFPMALQASIAPLAGEKDTTNNASEFRFRAVTQRRKLLLLDGRPRWELRYLRNMFERNPQWEVNTLTAGTDVNDEWKHGDAPGQLPATREAWFAYDLIGFGEVPPKLLTAEELGWLKEFVGTRGGGLFFVNGQRDVLRNYAEGPLAPLFPIEWIGKNAPELPTHLQLTDRGASFGPLRFAGSTAENRDVWKQLLPPHWIGNTKALPGTETLVEAIVGAQKFPAIALRPFGSGKVLFMGTDETWRWRYDVADKYQDAFWHQIADAVMEPSYAVRNKHIALDAGGVNYNEGDIAEIRVRLRDEQGRSITSGHPTATLSRNGQKIATISLAADENSGGAFRGKTAALAPGNYEVRVDAARLVPETRDMPVAFHVENKNGDASMEMSELNANEDLLQQMAKTSNGEFFREEDAQKIVNKLYPLSKGRIEESETVLWQSGYWFAVVLALLTTEWIIRKRTGLI